MTSLLTRLVVKCVRGWTWLYTWHMPPALRATRRAEIESDLWEWQGDAAGDHSLGFALQILLRFLIGIPNDLGWRLEQAAVAGGFTQRSIVLSGRVAGAVLFIFTSWVIHVDAGRTPRAVTTARPAVFDRAIARTPMTRNLPRLTAGIMATVGVSMQLAAQSAPNAAKPRFEVASVKSSAPDPLGLPGGMRPTPGRFTMLNAPLRFLVLRAYGPLFDFQIISGPDWQKSRRFDIQATAESAAVGDEMLPMLRTLLEERFQLKVHTETREMPIYALVVARDDGRLGANIKLSTTDCSDPALVAKMQASAVIAQGVPCALLPVPTRVAGSTALRAIGASMAALAKFMAGTTGQIVQDRTGLSGFYDWEMTYDSGVRGVASAPSTSESPVLTTALQEQLGVKLESTHGPVEVLVIDSAALPAPD